MKLSSRSWGDEATRDELGRLTAAFFEAVSFNEGESPAYDAIEALFITSGLLIKNSASTPEICSVREFVEPRQAMVAAGELSRFREQELSETTVIFGSIAHRLSVYAKSGTMKGVAFEARGVISTQFIRTSAGWKMSAMAWDDERPGLSIPERFVAAS